MEDAKNKMQQYNDLSVKRWENLVRRYLHRSRMNRMSSYFNTIVIFINIFINNKHKYLNNF